MISPGISKDGEFRRAITSLSQRENEFGYDISDDESLQSTNIQKISNSSVEHPSFGFASPMSDSSLSLDASFSDTSFSPKHNQMHDALSTRHVSFAPDIFDSKNTNYENRFPHAHLEGGFTKLDSRRNTTVSQLSPMRDSPQSRIPLLELEQARLSLELSSSSDNDVTSKIRTIAVQAAKIVELESALATKDVIVDDLRGQLELLRNGDLQHILKRYENDMTKWRNQHRQDSTRWQEELQNAQDALLIAEKTLIAKETTSAERLSQKDKEIMVLTEECQMKEQTCIELKRAFAEYQSLAELHDKEITEKCDILFNENMCIKANLDTEWQQKVRVIEESHLKMLQDMTGRMHEKQSTLQELYEELEKTNKMLTEKEDMIVSIKLENDQIVSQLNAKHAKELEELQSKGKEACYLVQTQTEQILKKNFGEEISRIEREKEDTIRSIAAKIKEQCMKLYENSLRQIHSEIVNYQKKLQDKYSGNVIIT